MSYLLNGWLDDVDCPVVRIERDEANRLSSLQKMGLVAWTDEVLKQPFKKAPGISFPWSGIWVEDQARLLWQYLLPDEPFDALRYRQLVRLQVQPHPEHWKMNVMVLHELRRIGLLTI